MKSHYNDDNDKQMPELLKNMPQVNDHLDKNELFQRISQEMGKSKPLKQKKSHLLPILSTILTAVIILAIIPVLFNNTMFQSHEEQSSNNAADSKLAIEEYSSRMEEDSGQSDDGNPEFSLFGKKSEDLVLNEIDDQSDVVHAAVTDLQGQYVIPLSFIKQKTEKLTGYYNDLENYINNEKWGVSDFLFKGASFKIDYTNNLVMVNLPEGFSLNPGSANANVFQELLSNMFGQLGLNKVIFETIHNQGVNLGPIGIVKELPIRARQKSSYKVYQASPQKRKFLIPVPQTGQMDIEAAFDEMKQNEEAFNVFRTIPNDIRFDINKSGEQLAVTFSDGILTDTSITPQKKNTMIEAMLMTAKSYGYKSVKFNNAGIKKIGKYNLAKAIKVPLAVNPIMHEQ
ncbi:hypothetical protein [Virgibacillus oceani]|uniref:Anti-sigma-X factor RsiX n=1 Tax=Virgibacillus oceani TaxID=1479511 RepID=A0A917H2T2_9BACI|nr:hypothetical protein [Virgibacillus oceani]GGG64998.1 anti-sigma-X factor RsiX [Virgibacillus oceani]